MTEHPHRPRGNPAPRPALPRRTIEAEARQSGPGPVPTVEPVPVPPVEPVPVPAPEPARARLVGRDALVPPGSQRRGARAPIPSVTDLMPRTLSPVAEPAVPSDPPTTEGRKPAKHKHKADSKDKGAAREHPADGKTVEVVARIPKGLRKRLRTKAEANGMTAEQALSLLVSVWVDG